VGLPYPWPIRLTIRGTSCALYSVSPFLRHRATPHGARVREPVGLILAGGRGVRMGGVAKAGLMLGGRTLLTHCTARLDPQVCGVAVNTNAALDTTLPVVPDTMAGHLGPLAGILAGLDWARAQGATHMVSVAVDTPFFPCDLVPQLLLAGEGHAAGLAVAATTDGAQGTFGVWPVALQDALADFIANGGRRVRDFTEDQGAATADFPDPKAFFNINTPDDLAQAAAWL